MLLWDVDVQACVQCAGLPRSWPLESDGLVLPGGSISERVLATCISFRPTMVPRRAWMSVHAASSTASMSALYSKFLPEVCDRSTCNARHHLNYCADPRKMTRKILVSSDKLPSGRMPLAKTPPCSAL